MTETKANILLVEDSESFQQTYGMVLRAEGYDVSIAAHGQEAINILGIRPIDLVVLDLVMPGKTGFDVLREMRSDAKFERVPILVFSVMGDQDNIRKALDLGANDYAIKGKTTPREIVHKVESLLESDSGLSRLEEFSVEIKSGFGDAAKLQQHMGVKDIGVCDSCGGNMRLHMQVDPTRTNGHWFISNFSCEKCHKSA